MDQSQKKYAMDRVLQVFEARKSRLREQCTCLHEVDDGLLLDAIRDGDVELKKKGVTMDTPLRDAFQFRGVRPESIMDQKKFQTMLAPIKKMYDGVRDAIMLGDETVAQRLIAEFCKES